MTGEQVAVLKELQELHNNLQETDYKITRYCGRVAAGLPTKLTPEEFAALEVQRDAWRARINELEVV